MAVQAYILIETAVGRSFAVATAAAGIDGVTNADQVTGPYDVIVRATAPSIDDLGRLVVTEVQSLEGVTRTLTCPIIGSGG